MDSPKPYPIDRKSRLAENGLIDGIFGIAIFRLRIRRFGPALFVLILTALALSIPSALAIDYPIPADVLGISLGMSKEDAIKKIQDYDKDMSIQILKGTLPDGVTQVDREIYAGLKRKTKLETDRLVEIIALFLGTDERNSVLAILRVNADSDENPRTEEYIEQNLAAKYGAPHYSEKDPLGFYNAYWVFDSDGKIEHDDNEINHCKIDLPLVPSGTGIRFHDMTDYAFRLDNSCGLTIWATSSTQVDNDNLNKAFSIAVIDFNLFRDDEERIRKLSLKATGNRKQMEIDKAQQQPNKVRM
jgi:hypothetical protein